MHQIVKQFRVAVGHLLHGFFAALNKKRIPLLAIMQFPKGTPLTGNRPAFTAQHKIDKRNGNPGINMNIGAKVPLRVNTEVLAEHLKGQFITCESSADPFRRLLQIMGHDLTPQCLQEFVPVLLHGVLIPGFIAVSANCFLVQAWALAQFALSRKYRSGKCQTGLFTTFPTIGLVEQLKNFHGIAWYHTSSP